jgi:phosphoadenosine phosphosulfate reductase
MSSEWWDGISNNLYKDELKPLLDKVERYAANTKPKKEVAKFVESGGWKARMGGKGLETGGNRITEVVENDSITFMLTQMSQPWDAVAHILGKTVSQNGNSFSQLIDGKPFYYRIELKENGSCHVSYRPYSAMDRFLVSRLRGVANKVAYCRGCKACEVQCPTGAYVIDGNGSTFI